MKPIALQLYTLREELQKDFKGTLEQVARIGFKGVETAGLYGMKPKDFREQVENLGMTVSSSHIPWPSVDSIQETVDLMGELGTDLVSSGFSSTAFSSLEVIQETANLVNTVHEKLADAGLTLTLHNHWWEFEEVGGDLAFRHVAGMCPDVRFEIDTYWAANFGRVDPVAIVKEYAGRAPLLHIKDGTLVKDKLLLPVGSGELDVPGVLAAADSRVLQWVVVELDNFDGEMLFAVEESYKYLTGNNLVVGNR